MGARDLGCSALRRFSTIDVRHPARHASHPFLQKELLAGRASYVTYCPSYVRGLLQEERETMAPVHVLDNFYLAITLFITIAYQFTGFFIAWKLQVRVVHLTLFKLTLRRFIPV